MGEGKDAENVGERRGNKTPSSLEGDHSPRALRKTMTSGLSNVR